MSRSKNRSNAKIEQETKRLYFENPYQVEFEAQVVEKVILEQKPALILDQTCFYPESGGQPYDKGLINEIKVSKVLEDEGRVIHLLEEDISSDSVQSPDDPECAYRNKNGNHVRGYSTNITETCSDDDLNLITNRQVEKANTQDIDFVQELPLIVLIIKNNVLSIIKDR